MRKAYLTIVLAAAFAAQAEIDVVPYPSAVVEKAGVFKCPAGKKLQKVVRFSKDASIPREGYRLSVTANGIKVAASAKAGAFYALQTLEQLKKSEKGKTVIPCMEIEDFPRYSWRGLHIPALTRRGCRNYTLRECLKFLI